MKVSSHRSAIEPPTGPKGPAVGGTSEQPGEALSPAQAITRVRSLLEQLEELEPRLAAAASSEVEMTLLERATELVEEAGRILEHLGRVVG